MKRWWGSTAPCCETAKCPRHLAEFSVRRNSTEKYYEDLAWPKGPAKKLTSCSNLFPCFLNQVAEIRPIIPTIGPSAILNHTCQVLLTDTTQISSSHIPFTAEAPSP